MKELEVVAAIIEYDNKILCLQRGQSKFPSTAYKYEFPGGKVESGEKLEEALSRELNEELEMNVVVKSSDYFMTVHHEYPEFTITMHSFIVKVDSPDFVRKEHINQVWASPNEEMRNLDWAAADKPIVERLIKDK